MAKAWLPRTTLADGELCGVPLNSKSASLQQGGPQGLKGGGPSSSRAPMPHGIVFSIVEWQRASVSKAAINIACPILNKADMY